jgi:hypothetical protein
MQRFWIGCFTGCRGRRLIATPVATVSSIGSVGAGGIRETVGA